MAGSAVLNSPIFRARRFGATEASGPRDPCLSPRPTHGPAYAPPLYPIVGTYKYYVYVPIVYATWVPIYYFWAAMY